MTNEMRTIINRVPRRWIWIILIALLASIIFLARSLYTDYPPPRPGTGAVVGKLELDINNARYNAQDLYLARLVDANQSGVPPVVSFTYESDPHTILHEADGRFAFTDVPPGNYALVIWNPGISFVIDSPEGGLLKVTVVAGQTVNLGRIVPPY